MKNLHYHTFLTLSFLLLNGCGGGSSSPLGFEPETLVEPTEQNSVVTGTASTGNLPILAAVVNTAPTADEIDLSVESTGSDYSITLHGNDVDADALSYTLLSQPNFGTLSGTAPNLKYTPFSTYRGEDSFAYVVNDGTVDSNIANVHIDVTQILGSSVEVSGKITYDHIPVKTDFIGLDYNNVTMRNARKVLVVAVDASNAPYASTTTDENGDYVLTLAQNEDLKVQVYAKLRYAAVASWDVTVLDNANFDEVYVMEGNLISTGTTNSTRNLFAPSGWDGSRYASTRVAAPFALLDSVYASMLTVLEADPQADFPPLRVNWSIKNRAYDGDPSNGDIGTSYYYDRNLYILGDEDSDTDEYDDHVVSHEWGHYYEDVFSRSDSVGGSHGASDILDIRVAFGEGWGNAFSAMALGHPVYFDTLGFSQSDGFNFDVESGTNDHKGWYSEGSIQRILYDLFDDSDDGSDTLSFGFSALHSVFTQAQKNTPVYTSLFPFISYLKNENPSNATQIDMLTSSEDIATIIDIYGNGRSNLTNETPLYLDLIIGSSVNICPGYAYGTYNKLGNRKFVRFNVNSEGTYTIKLEKSNTTTSYTDPDFYLYDVSNHQHIHAGEGVENDLEQASLYLKKASYLMDVSDYESVSGACFNVTVN